MAPDDAWTVRDHGPLEQLAENLWRVEGAVPKMSLRRNMVVARREDGALVIHNAIALRDDVQHELEALGEPTYLIVPNGWHRLDAPAYKKRYPRLRVYAPTGGRAKVEDKLAVDGTYEDFPTDPAVRMHPLPGVKRAEGAMLVTSRDGLTVVLTDCVFNMDRRKDVLGFLFTTAMGSAPGPRVSRLIKLLLLDDKAAFRAELERLAALPALQRVIVAHDKCSQGADAAATLREAAARI